MTPEEVQALFTRSDGSFLFARWGRPLAPVLFGVEDPTIATFKDAFEAMCQLAGHEMVEVDPDLGSNVMVFFCRSWADLGEVPNLDRLVPDLGALLPRLEAAQANQYRIFRSDEAGAIRAVFIFLRMDDALSDTPAEVLALSQAVQSFVLWSDQAFQSISPLATVDGNVMLKPEIAALLRAAYDPVLPSVAHDPSHALRLAARIGVTQ